MRPPTQRWRTVLQARRRARWSGGLLAMGLAIGIGAPGAGASEEDFDQQAATETAEALSRSLAELLADPGLTTPQPTAMQDRERNAAVVTIRELESMTKELTRRLESGRGFSATDPLYQQLKLMRGDIRSYARRTWLPKGTQEKAQRAAELLSELGRLYGDPSA